MENPISQRAGERVAQVRNQMKKTQAELARDMSARLGRDIQPLTVTRLEGGKRPISIDELNAIAEALRVTVQDLIGPGDLPVGAIRIQSAGAEAARAGHALNRAVREWIRAHASLKRTMESKTLESLPAAARMWVREISQWTTQQLVDEAIEEAEADDAET